MKQFDNQAHLDSKISANVLRATLGTPFFCFVCRKTHDQQKFGWIYCYGKFLREFSPGLRRREIYLDRYEYHLAHQWRPSLLNDTLYYLASQQPTPANHNLHLINTCKEFVDKWIPIEGLTFVPPTTPFVSLASPANLDILRVAIVKFTENAQSQLASARQTENQYLDQLAQHYNLIRSLSPHTASQATVVFPLD